MADLKTDLTDELVASIAALSKAAHAEVRIEKDGRTFSTKKFEEVLLDGVGDALPLELSSLESLAAFIEEEAGFYPGPAGPGGEEDDEEGPKNLVVIEDVETVLLVSSLHGWPHPKRQLYARASCHDAAAVDLGGSEPHFLPIEKFLIFLRSKFVPTPHLDRLLEVLGNATWEQGITQLDDGVSQGVTTRAGTVLPTVEAIPKYLSLRPYRTFRDVEQPESSFILRARGNVASGVYAALIEADGGAWRLEAMRRIKAWFGENNLIAIG